MKKAKVERSYKPPHSLPEQSSASRRDLKKKLSSQARLKIVCEKRAPDWQSLEASVLEASSSTKSPKDSAEGDPGKNLHLVDVEHEENDMVSSSIFIFI